MADVGEHALQSIARTSRLRIANAEKADRYFSAEREKIELMVPPGFAATRGGQRKDNADAKPVRTQSRRTAGLQY